MSSAVATLPNFIVPGSTPSYPTLPTTGDFQGSPPVMAGSNAYAQPPQAPASGTGNDYLDGLQQWLQQIEGMGAGYTLTDSDISNLANFQLEQQLYQQDQDNQYKTGYLQYLNQNLGLQGDQLTQAKQELQFQTGPYWTWYTQQYFPAMQQQNQNQLDISNNQVLQAQESTKQAQSQSKQAENYAYAQALGAQQAKFSADASRYQQLGQLGLINIPGPVNPRGY